MNLKSYFEEMEESVETLWFLYNSLYPEAPLDVEFISADDRRYVIIHDYLHILLMRGFSDADEAIVIAVNACIAFGTHDNTEIVKLTQGLPAEYIAICKQ